MLLTILRGDLIKIAGDAVFVLFPTRTEDKHSVPLATLRAVLCANVLQKQLGSYKPTDDLVLKLRFSIAVGDCYGIHVGALNRWEFLIMGDPLRQVRIMEGGTIKQLGKILVSAEAWTLLSPYCLGTNLGHGVIIDSIKEEYLLYNFVQIKLKFLLSQSIALA